MSFVFYKVDWDVCLLRKQHCRFSADGLVTRSIPEFGYDGCSQRCSIAGVEKLHASVLSKSNGPLFRGIKENLCPKVLAGFGKSLVWFREFFGGNRLRQFWVFSREMNDGVGKYRSSDGETARSFIQSFTPNWPPKKSGGNQ